MTSFREYMIKNHIKDDSPEGDLARDIKSDPRFPKTAKSYSYIRNYLKRCFACNECLETFDGCWKKFNAEEGAAK